MRTRPFLSHKRQDKAAVVNLKRQLCLYGAGGWRDLDDLLPGEATTPGFEKAINETTGGFIWYGTRRAAASSYINRVELPLAAARKRRQPSYPLVPLFVNVPPGEALATVRPELSDEDFKTFRDCNGEIRGPRSNGDFHPYVASRYVRSAIAGLDQDSFTVAVTAMAEPDGNHDFTLDWRTAVPEHTRAFDPGMEAKLRVALVAFSAVGGGMVWLLGPGCLDVEEL